MLCGRFIVGGWSFKNSKHMLLESVLYLTLTLSLPRPLPANGSIYDFKPPSITSPLRHSIAVLDIDLDEGPFEEIPSSLPDTPSFLTSPLHHVSTLPRSPSRSKYSLVCTYLSVCLSVLESVCLYADGNNKLLYDHTCMS